MPSNRNIGNTIGSVEYPWMDTLRKGYTQASVCQDVIVAPDAAGAATRILSNSIAAATSFQVDVTSPWPRNVEGEISGIGADVDVTVTGYDAKNQLVSKVMTLTPGGGFDSVVWPFWWVTSITTSATHSGTLTVQFANTFALSAPVLGATILKAATVVESTGATDDETITLFASTTGSQLSMATPTTTPNGDTTYHITYLGGNLESFTKVS